MEAARIALGIKNQVPKIIINDILNIVSIKNSLQFVQIKLWNKYLTAPSNMIIKQTFNEWKEYIDKNGNNYQIKTRSMKNKNELNNEYINFSKFKYINRSPLSRAYLLIEKLHKFEINQFNENKYNKIYDKELDIEKIFKEREIQVMKALPIYEIRMPNNIEVCDMYEKKPNKLADSYIFYLDGSCKPNPGPGAAAFFSPNYCIKSKVAPILHDTTINYAELKAFELVFESICNLMKNKKIDGKNITIYTDSLFCCNLFKITGYAKLEYYYKVIQNIFKQINQINKLNNNINIKIIKVKSHSNIKGNDIVDMIAKMGADMAVEAKNGKNELKYNRFYNSIMVDNYRYNELLKQIIKRDKIIEWNLFEKNCIENENMFKGESIYLRMRKYGCNNNEWNENNHKEFYNEYKFLNQKEVSIINKIRTEYINLNNYVYYYHEKNKKEIKDGKTMGKCKHCKCNENISHYILDCKLYENQRKKLFKKLRNIDIKFKNQNKITILDLLFPHLWQIKYAKEYDENYKEKNNKNIRVRVEIFKQIVKYTETTRRFNGQYGE